MVEKNINSIAFFIPDDHVATYQVKHKINLLINDIMGLMQSLYFRNDNELKVITDSSKQGIYGRISLKASERLTRHDFMVRTYVINEIKNKLQNKYRDAIFEYSM